MKNFPIRRKSMLFLWSWDSPQITCHQIRKTLRTFWRSNAHVCPLSGKQKSFVEGVRQNGNNNTQATGCIDKHVFTFLQYVMFQFEADSSNFFYCTQFVLPSALIAALEHLLRQSHLRFWKYTFFWQGKQNPFLFVECWWMTMALLLCQMQSNEATNQCSENNEAVWVHIGKEWFNVHILQSNE